MLVFELASMLDKKLKLQVRHISTDKLVWEGFVSELKSNSFHGAVCVPDFIKPGGSWSGKDYFYPDFTIYFHYDNEYPQTYLSKQTVERLYGEYHDKPGMGVASMFSDLKNDSETAEETADSEYGCDMEHCRGDCDHCFDNKQCREEARKVNASTVVINKDGVWN